MIERLRTVLFAVFLVLASCDPAEQGEVRTMDPRAAIYLIGEARDCSSYKDVFAVYDGHDNAGIGALADGLADFSGETIVSIYDFVNAPLASKTAPGQLDEVAKRYIEAAADTLPGRPAAKIIVLTSPHMAGIDLLALDEFILGTGSRKVSLVCPMDLILNRIRDSFGEQARIAVVSDSASIAAGAYEPGLTRIPAGCPLDSLALDVDAVILDAAGLDAGWLEGLRKMNQNVFDSREAAAAKCYEILWDNNAFTHFISRPAIVEFGTVKKQDGSMILLPI